MEKKKIAFIELETHSSLLEQWYLLLKEMRLIDFHFFVHAKVNAKLSSIPKDEISVITSTSEIALDSFDGVVVNTLHRNFDQYSKVFQQLPTLCLVHNLNFSLFFKPVHFRNLLFEKERFVYYLKLYFLEKVSQKRKVILGAKQFGVLSESLLKEVNSKSIYEDKTSVIQMNYCRSQSFITSETINIVMPGNVSGKRKDISLLFTILPQLHPKTKLHFTFLGKPENDKVLRQLVELQHKCNSDISITHYNRFIPWEEYSTVISKAHLLLCPIKAKTSFYWVDECYGKTKVSGSEADCIHNGKVGLFPTTYPKMNWHNLYYENAEELASILNNLTISMLSSEYEKLQSFLPQYSFENVKSELENQLLQLINTN